MACCEATWLLVKLCNELDVYIRPWKDHCWSVLAREREVTLVPPLHCVITVGAAALWLFLTGCDTDGFDHRDSQSQGPRRVKGRGCCKLMRERLRERHRERERWLGLGPCVLQGWCWKQTENLNKDGSHQRERTLLFDILEDRGKKVMLPPWILVANVITDGIFPGWLFHMAHDLYLSLIQIWTGHLSLHCVCFLLCAAFIARVYCLCSPRVSCHNIKCVSRRLDWKQHIIIITLHVREREGHRGESDGYQKDWQFPLQIPSFPLLLVVGLFSHLGCLRAKWAWLLFKKLSFNTLHVSL